MFRRAALLMAACWCGLAAGSLAVVVAAVASLSSRPDPAALIPPAATAAAAPAADASPAPAPRRLERGAATTRWASLSRDADARVRPSREAGRVALLSRVTPEGTANVVLQFGSAVDSRGREWVRAQIPGLPSRQVGWIERDALGPGGASRARVVVDRERLALSYVRAGRELLRARIGIGRAETPTPAGRFYVRNRLTRYAGSRLGPLAYGLSAQSRLSDWPGGGFIGITGTGRPDLLPGAVSRGCIRMANADIVALGRLLRVGTPVEIV